MFKVSAFFSKTDKQTNTLSPLLTNQKGNIFFALFGAVVIVGLLGTAIVSTMRGPLKTMVEVQSRAQAESEMAIASRLALLEATELAGDGDCDSDNFIEPLEFLDAGAADAPIGGGFLPNAVASSRTDPWGTNYGYCAWDAGGTTDDILCDISGNGNNERLDGNGNAGDETYTVIAIISAGPDQVFGTTCTGGAMPSITKTGDDIVTEFTYASAAASTGGLWNIKSGDPNIAEIAKEIEVSGDIDLNIGGLGSGQLILGAASMLFPDEITLAICNGANDGLVRLNTAADPDTLQLCDDPTGWVSIGGSLWAEGAGDDIYYNIGTPQVGIGNAAPSEALDVTGNILASGNVTAGGNLVATGNLSGTDLAAAGNATIGGTLGVTGATTLSTLNATGATMLGNTLGVTGATTLSSTLGVTGATTLSSTLDVTGATTLGSTLDAQGDISNSGGNVTIDDNLVVTGTSDLQGNVDITGNLDVQGTISNSTGNVAINDSTDVTGSITASVNITATGNVTAGANVYVNNTDLLGPPLNCGSAEKLEWNNGAGWSCETDLNTGSSGTPPALDDLTDVVAAAPTNGDCIIYNNVSGDWENGACAAGSGLGVFEVDTNVVRVKTTAGDYTNDDFVFGSPQLADDTDPNHDARMFFDKSKGAFRAGGVNAAQWDDANRGLYSIAMGSSGTASGNSSIAIGENATASNFWSIAIGNNVTASNFWSVAIGRNNTSSGSSSVSLGSNLNATGDNSVALGSGSIASGITSTAMGGSTTASNIYSTAMGFNTIASGENSTAMGSSTTAAGLSSITMGQEATVTATGANSFAFGLGDAAGAYPQVSGSNSLGIFMGDQTAVDITTANTMALMGGRFILDPNIPATELATSIGGEQDLELDIEGDIGAINYCDEVGNDCFTASEFSSGGGGLWTDLTGGRIHYGTTSTNQVGVGTANPQTTLDVNGGVRVGSVSGGAAPSFINLDDLGDVAAPAPTDGECLVYNNTSGDWENAACAAGSGLGVFEIAANVVRVKATAGDYTNDDFIFGSPQLADDGDVNHVSRMFFDKSKGSFRAGVAQSNQWDDANIGVLSTAIGNNTIASGDNSTAMGWKSTADGNSSIATGWNTVANGDYSASFGKEVTITATGDGSVGFGLTTGSPHPDPQISGASSFGIFMGDQSAVDISTANTMALMGGKMVIDPNVPATQLSARGVLDLGAATDAIVLPSGSVAQQPASPIEGMIRYNSDTDVFEGYVDDGTPAWEAINTGAGGKWLDGAGSEIYYDSANVGVGTATDPAVAMHVGGTLMVADGGEVCAAAFEGAIRYRSGVGVEYCDGTIWNAIAVNAAGVVLTINPPNKLDMDVTGPGNPALGTNIVFNVSNTGSVISNALTYTLSNLTNFVVTSDTCTGNTLAPAATCQIEITPQATADGTFYGTLEIPQHNNPQASLQGEGTVFGCYAGQSAFGGIVAACDAYGVGLHMIVTPGNCDGSLVEPTCDGGVDTVKIKWSTENIGLGSPVRDTNNGDQNSVNIINYGRTGLYPAAEYCDDLIYQGYSDWYLPASDEALNNIYPNRAVIGGFAGSDYRTSREHTIISDACTISMVSGGIDCNSQSKSSNYHIRCARKESVALPAAQNDTTPNDFTFDTKFATSAAQTITSDSVTITGITPATAISISGGQYSINGGAYTAAAGTIDWGDTVTIQLTSPAAENRVQSDLTIGTYTGYYSVITEGDCGGSCAGVDKRVFVTSTTYNGNLGGLAGADSKCQTQADAAALGGTWKAIISDTNIANYAAHRIDYNWDRLINMNGDIIATSATDLWDETLANPISYNENSVLAIGEVKTATSPNGSLNTPKTDPPTCDGWTSLSNYDHRVGNSGSSTSSWVSSRTEDRCIDSHRLYCAEVNAPTIVIALTPTSATTMDVAGPGTPAYGANVTFTATNSGTGTSAVLTASLSSSANFEILSDTCTGVTLAAAATCTYDVRPFASADGTYNATTTISDGAYSDSSGIDGTATGFAGTAYIFEVTGLAGSEVVSSIDANVPYTTADFVFGSPQLDDDGDANHDSRMFFDKSKSAFRAGRTQFGYWDDVNIGTDSTALGYNVKASGQGSVALGVANTASGTYSTAMGAGTIASGDYSFAIGGGAFSTTTAAGISSIAMGQKTTVTATGVNSFALGLGNATGAYPQVSGVSSFGIFLGDQSGVDVIQANAMVLMGGKLGIGEVSPSVELDVVGDIEYTGTITDVSDRRLKDNITPLNKTGSLIERINAIDTYSFTMKDDETDRIEFGVMAQELETIFPELVHTAQDEIGTKSVNYVGLIAPMIEATKEVSTQNAALKAEISELKAAQATTHASLAKISKQVALLNKVTGNNGGQKASMENYLMLLLGLLGGIGIMLVVQHKKKNA